MASPGRGFQDRRPADWDMARMNMPSEELARRDTALADPARLDMLGKTRLEKTRPG